VTLDFGVGVGVGVDVGDRSRLSQAGRSKGAARPFVPAGAAAALDMLGSG
jgi:hypothetical protein